MSLNPIDRDPIIPLQAVSQWIVNPLFSAPPMDMVALPDTAEIFTQPIYAAMEDPNTRRGADLLEIALTLVGAGIGGTDDVTLKVYPCPLRRYGHALELDFFAKDTAAAKTEAMDLSDGTASGSDVVGFSEVVSGVDAGTTAGSGTVALPAATDLSGVSVGDWIGIEDLVGGSYSGVTNLGTFRITAVDDGADTVTITPVAAETLSGKDWSIVTGMEFDPGWFLHAVGPRFQHVLGFGGSRTRVAGGAKTLLAQNWILTQCTFATWVGEGRFSVLHGNRKLFSATSNGMPVAHETRSLFFQKHLADDVDLVTVYAEGTVGVSALTVQTVTPFVRTKIYETSELGPGVVIGLATAADLSTTFARLQIRRYQKVY